MNHANPILAAWQSTLERHGNAPAILATDGGVLRTFAAIEEEARGFQSGLLARLIDAPGAPVARREADTSVRPLNSQTGVSASRRTPVGVQLGNDARFPALLIALWRCGLVPVPIDRSVEGVALGAALDACRAAALVTPGPDGAPVCERRAGGAKVDADFLKLTSGTSGAPRAIRFRAAQLLADCEAVCDTMGIGAGDLNFGAIPWSHSYGLSNLVTPLLCRGVPVVSSEDRLPRGLLDGLARSGATVFPGLPIFFQKLAELDAPPALRLRLCISAGAPLTAATAKAFRTRFGVKIHGFYGSSECGGIAYDASDDEVPEGCVGEPVRGVRLVHDEQTGRIEIHGPAVGEGYFPEPDEGALGGGRFVPGDLVTKTAHGFVLAGRVSDFINIAGRKLNPAEVEARLRQCPSVREAVVFGVPSRLRGEEPVACVVGDATSDVLRRFCRENLPPWQNPKDFWVVKILPCNERGKLNRRALADAYQTQLAR